MVLSKVNKEISYTELKTIDENDKGRDVTMYQINLFKIPVVIALGEIKFTFIDEKILFTPVYLVVDESNKIYQIGVYEFPAEKLENLKNITPKIEIQNWEKSGHNIHRDFPKEFSEKLINYIEK